MGVPQLQQAASKGDGVPQLEVDKLEPDVCDGREQQVAADEEVQRLDGLAEALGELAHAQQPAPDGQLRLFCGGRAVGLDDLLKRRRDARRLTAPPRPLLLHLLGRLVQPQRLVLERTPADAADGAQGEAEEHVGVREDDRHNLGRSDQDEVGGDGEDCAREKRLDRLVQRQHPAEAILLDKGYDGLIEEALDDAELEPHPEQPARDQRRVLLERRGADHARDCALRKAVEAVGRRAHRLEGPWVERHHRVHAEAGGERVGVGGAGAQQQRR
mmetsp:Transcript_15362/g.41425  ORF Transcript_15362/g.41425 Transcript_15362/m.41425 type:complete len:272 (-) Transcript_15362:158-973(-)